MASLDMNHAEKRSAFFVFVFYGHDSYRYFAALQV
jgi:hypothetical protein